jgi:hypothetical protein
VNPIRKGHGAGSGTPHVEIALKDQAPANAEQTAANLAVRKRRGKPFERGNRVGGRKLELVGLGIAVDGIPELARKDLRRANSYRQRRVREVVAVHKYASAGTCAVLGSAAITLASHRAVAALAFQTGDPGLHELAARLGEKHSQLELKAAWMAKNEAGSKPKADDPDTDPNVVFAPVKDDE